MSTSLLLRSTLPRHIARQRTLVGAVWLRNAQASTTAGAQEEGEFKYVPGGPIYKGTANNPTTFPPPNKSHGSYHWAFERLLAASLLPITGAAFVTSGSAYPVLDGILGVSLVMHSHIGFDNLLVDYVHPRKFPKLGPTLTWVLRVTTVGVLVGVYQFNTEDIGLTELVAKAWHA